VGCKKERLLKDSFSPSNYVENNTYCNDDIIDNYINMAALSLIDLIQQSSFVDLVHTEVAKMFDDDHEVLFKKIDEELELDSKNLVDMLSQSLDSVLSFKYPLVNNSLKYVNLPVSSISNQISDIIDGIEICSNKVYLQIYVPNFESINLNQTPIIALGHDTNPEDCITFGYQFIGDSIFIIDVDSALAANQLVWVISYNNVVDFQGEIPESFFKLSDTINLSSINMPEGNQIESRTDKDKQVRIHSFLLTQKKRRCFLCGKDEVALSGFFSDYGLCKPVDVPKMIFTHVLCKVGKNDLNKWIIVPHDKPRAWIAHPTGSPLRKYNEAIEFVWYCYDSRSRYATTFSCDHPGCSTPLPLGMRATYQTKYYDYGFTSYLWGGKPPLYYFDVPATSSMQMITHPDYNWYGDRIRFHGSNVAL
jgi:hypothetical protein